MSVCKLYFVETEFLSNFAFQAQTMDTKGLIEKVAADLDMSREQASEILDSLCGLVGEKCADLDSIAIPGFGSFEPRKKNERVTVHPSTGRRMLVPPKISLSFRPSALLKQKIKKG